jgi:8-oxo-dGTP diphosphatase
MPTDQTPVIALSYCAVAAVVRRGDQVLLVKQQGPADPEPVWTPPSGRVHVGESMTAAVLRELAEETGLAGPVGPLAYVSQHEIRWPSRHELWTTLCFEVYCDEAATPTPQDPDDLVTEATFADLSTAVELLSRNPVRPLADPFRAHILGETTPTTYWSWRIVLDDDDSARSVDVIAKIGPNGQHPSRS